MRTTEPWQSWQGAPGTPIYLAANATTMSARWDIADRCPPLKDVDETRDRGRCLDGCRRCDTNSKAKCMAVCTLQDQRKGHCGHQWRQGPVCWYELARTQRCHGMWMITDQLSRLAATNRYLFRSRKVCSINQSKASYP